MVANHQAWSGPRCSVDRQTDTDGTQDPPGDVLQGPGSAPVATVTWDRRHDCDDDRSEHQSKDQSAQSGEHSYPTRGI